MKGQASEPWEVRQMAEQLDRVGAVAHLQCKGLQLQQEAAAENIVTQMRAYINWHLTGPWSGGRWGGRARGCGA